MEWWGRGSYFNAGRYSFLCHDVVFSGSVARYSGGVPVLATPTTTWEGAGSNGACTSSLGTVQVVAQSGTFSVQWGVLETTPGQFAIVDTLRAAPKALVSFTATYSEEGFAPVECTFSAGSVRGTSTWVAEEQIMGRTEAGRFHLNKEASNSSQCPASGKLETSWRFWAAPPAGGFVPIVLAIH
jgi:hypothetical protein